MRCSIRRAAPKAGPRTWCSRWPTALVTWLVFERELSVLLPRGTLDGLLIHA